jgi:TQXA domain-containing protein
VTRGISTPSGWMRLGAVAAATGLALLAGTGTASARPMSPQPNDGGVRPQVVGDHATASVGNDGGHLFGTINGQNQRVSTDTISITFAPGAQDTGTLLTYCIAFNDPLSRTDPYTEVPFVDTKIPDAARAKILWILGHSRPNVPDAQVLTMAGVTGAVSNPAAVVYAGTQAAIWHYSDGLTLTARQSNTEFSAAQYTAVQQVYNFLTSAANTGLNGPPTLTITPPSATGMVGDVLGPFTVATSAPSIDLAVTGGATLLGADKTTAVTSVADGGQFFVKPGAAGTATVTGTGQGFISEGRAFIVPDRAPTAVKPASVVQAQKLILAQLKPQQVKVSVQVTASTPTPTPTTAAPTPTPTSPALAATGASPMPKVMMAVLLLLAGTALTMVARRRRGGSHA